MVSFVPVTDDTFFPELEDVNPAELDLLPPCGHRLEILGVRRLVDNAAHECRPAFEDLLNLGGEIGERGGTRAGGGNRTLVISLEGWGSTIELHPRLCIEAVQHYGRRSNLDLMALMPGTHLILASIAALAVGLVGVPSATLAAPPAVLCTLKPGQATLPPETLHGLAHHLRQYPDVSLATPKQRRAATELVRRALVASARWRAADVAAARGFNTHLAARAPGDEAVGYLHAEHRRNSADHHDLDPGRPESLIYATEPGRKPRLVGVMFSVARGVLGPTPGGPLTRWHSHIVCAKGIERGLTPRPDGTCPPGARKAQGSEMLHLWFTRDLRSASAVHAPVPELCRDGLLTKKACRAGSHRREM